MIVKRSFLQVSVVGGRRRQDEERKKQRAHDLIVRNPDGKEHPDGERFPTGCSIPPGFVFSGVDRGRGAGRDLHVALCRPRARRPPVHLP